MATDDGMSNTLGKLGNNLINAVLGGLILWVGQTALRHENVLAGVDEKMAAVDHQFEDSEKRQESMRKWMENAITDLKDNNRSHFTLKDGDKLVAQVRQAELTATELERRFSFVMNWRGPRLRSRCKCNLMSGWREGCRCSCLRWIIGGKSGAGDRRAWPSGCLGRILALSD